MAIQILRDQTGRKIGEIETRSNGEQIIRDATGQKRGRYDPKHNYTYDATNQRIGDGNLLASLVTSSQEINNPWGPLLGGIGGYLLGRMSSETDTPQSECEEGYVQENEPDENDESIPPVVEWENAINRRIQKALEPEQPNKKKRTTLNLPTPEIPTEAGVLAYCDDTQEEIANDDRLTDSGKNLLCELLNKRRKYFQELSQLKGKCIAPETRKTEEDKYRDIFEKILKEPGTKEAKICLCKSFLTPIRLKYNHYLTETQKIEISKLADGYIDKINKTDDAVTNANKEVLETDTGKKGDNATIVTENTLRAPEKNTLRVSHGKSKYITMAIVLFILLPLSAPLLGPLFLLGAPVIILVVYLLVSAIYRWLSRHS